MIADGAIFLLSSGFQSAAIPFRKKRRFAIGAGRAAAVFGAIDAVVRRGIYVPVGKR
jgi:hypothetical protein